MTLKEILADRGAYPDEAEIKLPSGEAVKLGDLRGLTSEEQRMVSARLKEAEDKERMIAAAREEISSSWAKLERDKQAVEQYAAQANANSRAAGAGDYDWRSDPYLKPIVEELHRTQHFLQEQRAQVDALRGNYVEAIEYNLRDKWTRDFDSAPNRPKDLKMEQALKYAVENNLKDHKGVPDVRRAIDAMTEPQRREASIKDAETKAYEKAKRELTLGRSRPGTNLPAAANVSKKFKNMDEAFEAARGDMEIFAPQPQTN